MSSDAPGYPLRTSRLVGGSNTTVTRRLSQAEHMRRDSRRESGKFGPRVQTSVSRSSCFSIDASPDGFRALAIAVGAPHVHLLAAPGGTTSAAPSRAVAPRRNCRCDKRRWQIRNALPIFGAVARAMSLPSALIARRSLRDTSTRSSARQRSINWLSVSSDRNSAS